MCLAKTEVLICLLRIFETQSYVVSQTGLELSVWSSWLLNQLPKCPKCDTTVNHAPHFTYKTSSNPKAFWFRGLTGALVSFPLVLISLLNCSLDLLPILQSNSTLIMVFFSCLGIIHSKETLIRRKLDSDPYSMGLIALLPWAVDLIYLSSRI